MGDRTALMSTTVYNIKRVTAYNSEDTWARKEAGDDSTERIPSKDLTTFQTLQFCHNITCFHVFYQYLHANYSLGHTNCMPLLLIQYHCTCLST